MIDYQDFKLSLQLFSLIHNISYFMKFDMMYDESFFREPSNKNFEWFSNSLYKSISSKYIVTRDRLIEGKIEYVLFLIEIRDNKNKVTHLLEFRSLLENSIDILNHLKNE